MAGPNPPRAGLLLQFCPDRGVVFQRLGRTGWQELTRLCQFWRDIDHRRRLHHFVHEFLGTFDAVGIARVARNQRGRSRVGA